MATTQAISNPLVATVLDLAAAWLDRDGPPHPDWLLLASAPAYVHGAIARCAGMLEVMAQNAPVESAVHQLLADGASGLSCVHGPGVGPRSHRHAALWMLPQPHHWRDRVSALQAMECPHRLVVVAPGALVWSLGTRCPRWLAGQSGAALLPELSKLGYQLATHYRIGQPATVVWAVLARAAGAVRRPDLVDRCEAAFRLTLAPPLPTALAVMNCFMLERPGDD